MSGRDEIRDDPSPLNYASAGSNDDPHWPVRVAWVCVFAVLSFPPAAMLPMAWTEFIYTGLQVGRLPTYMNPSPQYLPWNMPLQFVWGTLAFAIPCAITVISLGMVKRHSLQLVLPGLTCVLLWLVLFADPLGVLNWWLD